MIYFVIIFALIFSNNLFSFDEFKSDNGQLLGYMMNNKNWEESKTLKPPLPCKLIKLKIYFGGTIPTKDTLWISYDATDGYIPPSLFSRHIATLGNIIYDYDGKPGWKEFDVSNLNIRFGGTNGIVVQHLIKENGPFFGVDNQVQAQPNLTSFINNVFTPNPNFYNIRGTMYSITPGHYMVRSIVEYNNKNYNSEPTKSNKDLLIDVTKNSNLLNNNNFISSELSSICDLNNDGYDDIIIKNNFFVNKKDGNFERLNLNIPNNGIVSGDLDNDGFIDLFAVNGWGNDKIYWGTQSGTFIEETDNSIKVNAPTVSPLFLDYNNDGLLDIFIAYGRKEESGQETYYPDKLFKNLGNRKFVEVTNESGISKGEIPAMDCWGATITDFNNDGLADIFVATYRLAPDLLFKNNGDGTFTEVGAQTGARGVPTYYSNYFGHGMGADWGDYDNDGYLDLAVGNLSHIDERALASNKSLILRNSGPPNYSFQNQTDNLRLGFYEMNSGIVWADLDFDGYLDLIHSQFAYYQKGQGTDKNTRFYLNSGKENGYLLIDKTFDFGSIIHGACSPLRLDYDNDGDIDILVASNNENVKLFQNQIRKNGNWISFKVKSSQNGINPYGVSVTVFTKNQKYYRSLPGSQLSARASQNSNEIFFGLGYNKIDSIRFDFYGNINRSFVKTNIKENFKYIIHSDGNLELIDNISVHLQNPFNSEEIINQDKSVNLSWLAPDDENIEFIINLFDENNNIIEEFITKNKFYELNINKLNPNKSYYWKVKAKYFNKEYNWSDLWSFKVISYTNVESINNLFNNILQNIYPNPLAYDYLNLTLNLINNEKHYIKIYNELGKEILNYYFTPKTKGLETIQLDVSTFENGLYILKIDNFGKTETSKFIINK